MAFRVRNISTDVNITSGKISGATENLIPENGNLSMNTSLYTSAGEKIIAVKPKIQRMPAGCPKAFIKNVES